MSIYSCKGGKRRVELARPVALYQRVLLNPHSIPLVFFAFPNYILSSLSINFQQCRQSLPIHGSTSMVCLSFFTRGSLTFIDIEKFLNIPDPNNRRFDNFFLRIPRFFDLEEHFYSHIGKDDTVILLSPDAVCR